MPKLLCFNIIALVASLLMATSISAQEATSVVAPASTGDATADASELTGRDIFEAYDERTSGFVDLTVELEMVLRSKTGAETRRQLTFKEMEVDDDGNMSIIVFDAPRAIKGAGLLSHAHPDIADDQWLYLPATRRVKKVATRNKSGPFMGSEFAYEDLSALEIDRFEYQLLGEEPCGELNCWRVERRPLDEYSGYSRHEVLLDQQALRLQKIDYYNRRGELAKTADMSDYQLFDNGQWRAGRMFMSNHLSGKSTELIWRDFQFNQALIAERDFTTNALKRAR
ncbi:MAG: outer membrane lipoprotein-sorting protein [Pseudomonadaceae bacterium]|nr:outer membrane lipoprotein-sorting protein [Pseudomonadaceae bacterium]